MPPPREEWSPGGLGIINQSSRLARWAVALAAAMAVLFAILALTVRFDRSIEGGAVVRPQGGTWIAQAPWGGRIEQILVEEGTVVAEGAPLYRMNLQELENGRAALEKRRDLAQANIAVLTQQIPQARTRGQLAERSADSEWQRAKALRDRAKVDLELADREHESKTDLFKIGTVPEKEVKDAKAKCDKSRSDLSVAEQDVLVAEQRVEVARKEAGKEVEQLESQIRDSTRSLEDDRHQLEEVNRKLKEGTILAARGGTVMRRVVAAPVMVDAGAPLADVIPLKARTTVEIRIDAADVDKLDVGQKAWMRFAGRTDAMRGDVHAVAADAGTENGRSVYRVEVWLESTADRLALGLTGRAAITTGRTTLFELAKEWLLTR